MKCFHQNCLNTAQIVIHACLYLWLTIGIRAEKVGVTGFDDALGGEETVFEAKPGSEAIRHWAPCFKGSVRLVGCIQKTSLQAKAAFTVLVDGTTIWSQKLHATDSLPRGFDVIAYELNPRSKVEFRVTADTGPVRVSVAFQIVPEPYVTRWTPEQMTGYPLWSEEARRAMREKGQEILQTIRDASAAKRGKVVIPPGDYLFHANWSRASTLANIANTEIIAHGVTFWFEPPLVHGLLFENCSNVIVRGLTIDFTIPCWFQARVTEVDSARKQIRATLVKGYEPRNANGGSETEGNRTLMFYDSQGRFINHRHSPGAWRLSDDRQTVLCHKIERSGIPAVLKAGDYVVGTIRTGAALRSKSCSGMIFEDVNVWSSPGIAVCEGDGAGGNTYRRVRATRRPHTNRLQAFGADIFHLTGTDRGPTLHRCEMAYGADDNLNIHGSFGRVVKQLDDRRWYLEGAYEVGDKIEFRHQHSAELLGIAKVVATKVVPDGPSLAINDKYKAKGDCLVELDQRLELPPLSLVVLDGKRSASGFVLRDCWLHDNFQRTLINGSPNGLIQNNTLQNVGQGLCVQFETWGPWMEGPFARDLVIRNNRFLDAPPAGAAISVSMHPSGGGTNRRRLKARPVTNMTIEENYFGPTAGTPLVIHNVEGLKLHNNSIDFPANAPVSTNTMGTNWLYLQDCEKVSLRGNQIPRVAEKPMGKP